MKKYQENKVESLNRVPVWESNLNQNGQNQEELKYLWQQYQGLELEILELHQQIDTSVGHLGLQKLMKIYGGNNRNYQQLGNIKNGGISS